MSRLTMGWRFRHPYWTAIIFGVAVAIIIGALALTVEQFR